MCGPSLSVKGGMATVVSTYLDNLKSDDFQLRYISTYINSNKLIQILFFLYKYLRLFSLLLTRQYRIVHIHMTHKGSTLRKGLIALTASFLKSRYILHIHTDYQNYYESTSTSTRHLINRIFRKARCNIVLSETTLSWMRRQFPDCNVRIIPNGVVIPDSNRYNPDAAGILFLGNLSEEKGIIDLLRCIKQLDNCLSSRIKFFLCGNDKTGDIDTIIKSLGIQKRIAFCGWISPGQKDEFFNASALSVLPSYREGLPMSILESMASGIPCIASDVGGIPSIIKDNENGLLMQPGDIGHLAKCILYLINNPQIRIKLSHRAYKTVSDSFSTDTMVGRTIDLYNEIIKDQ